MSGLGHRPTCINCSKRLGKYISTVGLPLDRDVDGFLSEKFNGRFYRMEDKYETVCMRQGKMRKNYEARVVRQEQAKMRLMPGSNEPFEKTLVGAMHLRHAENDAGDIEISMYETRVRVWFGDYGPDRLGLFHSGECARRWANQIAGELRKNGRV